MSLKLNQWLITPTLFIIPLFLGFVGPSVAVNDLILPVPAVEEHQIELRDDCSCVTYIREKGIDMPRIGYAGNLKTNSLFPRVGGVVLINYNGLHHLAYIEAVRADGTLYVSDKNFKHYVKGDCPITYRSIPLDDPRIVGYYSDVI